MEEVGTEAIIDAVRVHPYLYDARNPKYNDKFYKDLIWEKISKELGLSVKDCRIRWKSIRDRYRREKLAEKRNDHVRWKYQPHLEFLAESMKPLIPIRRLMPETTASSASASENLSKRVKGMAEGEVISLQVEALDDVNADESNSWDYNDIEEEDFADTIDPTTENGNITEDNWLPVEDDPSATTTTAPPPLLTGGANVGRIGAHTRDSNRKNHTHRNDDLFNEVLMAMKKKYSGAHPNTSNNNGDEYANFIALMCEKMDKLVPADVDDVQIEILQLLNQKIRSSERKKV